MTIVKLKVLSVRFDETSMIVSFSNNREMTLPLDRYPRLRDASEAERNNWRLVGRGQGICWEAIDEDLSAAGFLDV